MSIIIKVLHLLKFHSRMPKVLIVRFSSIGDIVLTTPVLRCLKQQVDGVEVHFLTKEAFAGILNHNPYVDKVLSFENDLNKVIEELRLENYDFIADLHHNFRSLRVITSLKRPHQSFNKVNVQKWLYVNFKWNFLPKTHIVNRYFETVEKLNVVYDDKGLDFFIPVTDEVNINSLPEPFCHGYVAFVIGAKHYTKRLPPDKIIEIINRLQLPVVLLGGTDDKQESMLIKNQCGNLVYDACGKYNLFQSASLVKQSRLVITHDTGLMHIAAAFHKKIISVWGNTVPEFGMYPLLPPGMGKSVIIENNILQCRPCSKIGFDKCPKGHFKCMNETDVERLTATALSWWG